MTAEDVSNAPEETRSPRPASSARFSRRRLVTGVVVVLAAGAAGLAGSRIAADAALQAASSRLRACELGPAQWWLAWSAWLRPGDYRPDLLHAACHRWLKQPELWRASLQEAGRKGSPEHQLALETKLNQFQSGQVEEATEAEIAVLVAAGASLADIAPAVVVGHCSQGNAATAKAILERLPQLFDDAQADYLWGLYWRKTHNVEEAENRLKRALDARPGHELARAELAGLWEEQGHLRQALEQYVALAERSARSEAAVLGVARVLRKLGRIEEARGVLTPRLAQVNPSSPLELELAQIDLESGDCVQAERRLNRLRLDDHEATAFPAIVAFSLLGRGDEAQRLFDSTTETTDRSAWLLEMQVRLVNNPRDSSSVDQLRRLRNGPLPSLPGVPDRVVERSDPRPAGPGADLFAKRCGICHGVRGDGCGRAARYLFPRPRNFGAAGLQLASTRNGVASLDDVERVLARGMPGTAMTAFDALSQAERTLLAQEVLRLRREGAREHILRSLIEAGEEPLEAELNHAIASSTVPGQPIPLPQHWPAAGQAAEKGRQGFHSLGCGKCHGEDGSGAADQFLFDDQGEPNRPRDLVREPFKGGRERESIYLRLAAGMHGTAHPAAPNLPEEQLIELVEYVLALARPPQASLTNSDRRARAATRIYLETLGRP